MIALAGCSRKKDTFINRNWHAVTSEYNTLYNGNLAFDLGKQQIAERYKDSYWDILPVERMQVSEEILLPGTIRNENFKVAEEKATKAIQRHSMLIGGKEKNPQIDEAYLLLGKARYYDQRFMPALEAFNYILHKYPASNTINHAQIWREKVNMRLDNDVLAVENLERLLKNEMSDQDVADANAILAQAYINLGSLEKAVTPILLAAKNTKSDEEKGRYYFIAGQLYNRLEKRDSANLAFTKVVDLNRKIPREYLINAQLEQARNFNFAGTEPGLLLERLKELEENRENRPFLDKIYFQIAEYYNHIDSTRLADIYYNKSLRTPSEDNFLQSVNYESLADINFEKAQYRTAGAYYDSTLTKIPDTSRDYFVIKRKRDNLQEVILYEESADRNDSIIRLVDMNPDQRIKYFKDYTAGLKAVAVADAQKGVLKEEPAEPVRRGPGLPPAMGAPGGRSNSFYFYNSSRVAAGMQEFLRVWGPRELKDNWRTTKGNNRNLIEGELDEVSELIIANNPLFDPRTYLEKIPSDPDIIDSIRATRSEAYYKLGLIYKDKFRENDLAAQRLISLLDFTSEEKYVAPALYNLYLMNMEEGAIAEAEKNKNLVIKQYPESRYAARLMNPNAAIAVEDEAITRYNEMYRFYELGDFFKVLQLGEQYKTDFEDNEIISKIELLYAMAEGRLRGFEAYKEALGKVARNFPQTDEGKKAQELLTTALPRMAGKEFVAGADTNVKLVYSFNYLDLQKAESVKETIDKALASLNYKGYNTSLDAYDQNQVFVVVHGIEDSSRAEGLAELLLVNKDYMIDQEPVVITTDTYRVVQLHKNLDSYKEFRNNNK